jgi:hypothetical protein
MNINDQNILEDFLSGLQEGAPWVATPDGRLYPVLIKMKQDEVIDIYQHHLIEIMSDPKTEPYWQVSHPNYSYLKKWVVVSKIS